jgi:ABC-2 type transport system ATP-binding protein
MRLRDTRQFVGCQAAFWPSLPVQGLAPGQPSGIVLPSLAPPMINVQNVTRRFGGLTAVNDLTFQVEKGEVVGFLGLNGAGKSTTMRMMTGYLPATSGSLRIGGFDVLTDSLEVRRRIGYLAEGVPLYREHRVSEMLAFQGRLFGMKRADIRRRTGEVLDRVGLSDRSRSLVGKLSKGMRQRVGIAVALLHEPDVLILDEPTSGLDPLQRVGVRRLVSELAEDHTVMISSHILPEIEAVCGRLILLHKGAKVADGTKHELLKKLGGSHLKLVVAASSTDGLRLKQALGGVLSKEELGKEGSIFVRERGDALEATLRVEQNPSEAVGLLAAARGWILRELSWHEPSLEQLFGRLATGAIEQEEESAQQAGLEAPDAGEVQVKAATDSESTQRKDSSDTDSTQPGAGA